MDDLQPIINEYPLDYCFLLEDVYGTGLMSEGGVQAIDDLVSDFDLRGKTILDVGSGLGGLAFHLARQCHCQVIGLEINKQMIDEANRRIPIDLKDKVRFQLYSDFSQLPFEDEAIDLICSKGVLVHVNDKVALFKELNRVLKREGSMAINDWLSSTSGKWGEKIQKMCELENLTLYPLTCQEYVKVLEEAGFQIKARKDKSEVYSQYNQDLVKSLEQNKEKYLEKYGEEIWRDTTDGYRLISESQAERKLLVFEFVVSKK